MMMTRIESDAAGYIVSILVGLSSTAVVRSTVRCMHGHM